MALIAMVAFNPDISGSAEKTILSALAMGLLMLPFFLFSSLAGELADRNRKSQLIKITKSAEVVVMALAAVFFYFDNFYALLLMLFFMGTQSTFFGPLKYGLLPEILEKKDLVAANGMVEASTFLAIVLGTLAGSFLVTLPQGTTVFLPLGLMLVSLSGLWCAFKQPQSQIGDPDLEIHRNIFEGTLKIIGSVRSRPHMWLTILAISWFWALGSVLITQLPILCASIMGATQGVSTFLVTLVAVGVALGSLGAQKLLHGEVSPRLVPVTAAFLTLFLSCLAAAIAFLPVATTEVTLVAFLSQWEYVRLALSTLLVCLAGGIFVVPLYALMQHQAEKHERSRVIASNNIINALFICVANLAVMILTALGLGLVSIFIITASSGLVVSFLTLYFLPKTSLKILLTLLLKIIYRPRISGLEHLETLKEGPVLVVANHTSFLDVVLLVFCFPRTLTFAIDSGWAQAWWLKPLLKIYKSIPINSSQPLATRSLIEALRQGDMVVIFPEGRVTTTGSLMKIYDGPGLIAAKSNAPILPVHIGGAQYTRLGKLGWLKNRPKKYEISVTIFPPQALAIKPLAGEKQRDLRHRAAMALYDIMVENQLDALNHDQNLWVALKKAARNNGSRRLITEDIRQPAISYGNFLLRAKLLGQRLSQGTAPGGKVGLLLPGSVALMASMFGLWSTGRVAVMLNPTQGSGPLMSALKTAEIKKVVTSRQFLEATGLTSFMENTGVELVYLEEESFTVVHKLKAWLGLGSGRPARAQTPAVVLFTSGSEGKPKGVVLSHSNILANVHQINCHLLIHQDDILFNALPMFHAFGLTIGGVLPLISGIRSYVYSTPLHTKIIPELIYSTRATLTFASDTFAAAWGKNANPYDFSSIRIMLVGAEKLKDKTRTLYSEKLGVRIFEGYGTTETSPVLAINNHLYYRAGSVGRLLPGIKARLEPVEGVEQGGRLVIKGPNVMMGYLHLDRPGVIVPPKEGCYDTADIVEIDTDGFVFIKGRFKSFAKIAGEMVSLAAIEEVMSKLWPDRVQSLITLEDDLKGEKIVLVTQDPKPRLSELWQALKEAGHPELSNPREFIYLANIPMTPLGKINMPRLMEEALEAKESLKK